MKLIEQHKIINILSLLIAVSVSSCNNNILDAEILSASGNNMELSFTRANSNATVLDDKSFFNVAFFMGEAYTPFLIPKICKVSISIQKMPTIPAFPILAILQYMQWDMRLAIASHHQTVRKP